MKRKKFINTTWSPSLAYVVGVITTDGNLSKDSRHIDITSKDLQLIEMIKLLLNLKNKIGKKARGGSTVKKYFRIQFGRKTFYDFLLRTGLTPAKSKTLKQLDIPKQYFFDFLRGCIDGDGSITTSLHPESTHLQLKLRLVSASEKFLIWIKNEIDVQKKISTGWISYSKNKMFTLCYGKHDSIKLINYMYHTDIIPCLKRKYELAKPYLKN